MVNPHDKKCAHENFYGNIPDYKKYLRALGETEGVCSIASAKEKWKIKEIRACS